MEPNLKREVILDNYANPFHNETKDNSFLTANGNNISCIDNINLFIKTNDDIISDAYFDGDACAITISSSSILMKNIIGKSIEDAKYFVKQFENMINEKEYNKDILNEALAYDEMYKQENRKNCALLPYKTLLKIIN